MAVIAFGIGQLIIHIEKKLHPVEFTVCKEDLSPDKLVPSGSTRRDQRTLKLRDCSCDKLAFYLN
jgi:hypothetical protein